MADLPNKIFQLTFERFPVMVQYINGEFFDGDGNLIDIPRGTGTANVSFYFQNTVPDDANVVVGSRWFHSDTGNEYVYIDDGDSFQWVQASSTIAGSLNHQVIGVTESSYTIVLNSQYGPEYFGVSSSTTSYVNLPTDVIAGKTITIKDESGRAAIHPIYLVPFTGEAIDNSTQVQLAINYGSLTMLRRNNNWWII